MTEEVKAKSRVSNRALLITLGVLILVIVALIVGIVVVNINITRTNEVYERAQATCDSMREAQATLDDDVYGVEVAKFEAMLDSGEIDRNDTKLKYCYAILIDYYGRIAQNQDKAMQYSSLYSTMMTDEEREMSEQMRQARDSSTSAGEETEETYTDDIETNDEEITK